MHSVLGNIHIHSTHSDGAADISEIAKDAAAAGLDYIMITDHQTLAGLPKEGVYDGVLVLVGSEINIAKHHYLALGIGQQIPANDEDPQVVIDAVHAQGGLGFIAHPYESGSPLVLGGVTYPWLNWQVEGFTGIEVWNWCSQFRDGVQNLAQGLYYAYLNPEGPITGPSREAMARFDDITQKRKITAIAGSDAHDWQIKRGPIRRRIFPYEYLFRAANNCLLLSEPLAGDLRTAKAQIFEALRLGRAFIVNGLAAPHAGFSFTIQNAGTTARLGDSIALTEDTTLTVACAGHDPAHVRFKVIHNGNPCWDVRDNRLERKLTKKGTYRVEIRLKRKPWIFTNPIYVV